MGIISLIIIIIIIFYLSLLPTSSATSPSKIKGGSSLSVEKPNDILISPNGDFSAGFHQIGDNAFFFATWFTKSSNPTLIWIPNRDQPVNGKGSKLSVSKRGNLILTDADDRSIVWTSTTSSNSSVQLQLHNSGNLVLITNSNANDDDEELVLWQSFDFPTHTLLPQQPLTRQTTLVSSRSQTNHSSGFYKLLYSNDNVLTLLYDGLDVSSIYWPAPYLMIWETGRTTYNSSKIAVLDASGYFRSSDGWEFSSSDYGLGPQRRLTLDVDGNLRCYSLSATSGEWSVSWQAVSDPCLVHGLCGPNSVCSYGSGSGRGCSCLPGHRMKDPKDWSNGCEQEGLNSSSNNYEVSFARVNNVELFGYEYDFYGNSTLESCKMRCLNSSICKGFLFKFEDGLYNCYPKSLLLNGKHWPGLLGTLYVKLNTSQNGFLTSNVVEVKLNCSGEDSVFLDRSYERKPENKLLEFFMWFICGVGVVEIVCIVTISWLIFWTAPKASGARTNQGYILVSGFRKFTYGELKRATGNFCEEIGRGGGGVVYKGVLSDGRFAAIKRLNEGTRGEEELLAEVSTIGRLHHMNLIQMWGYCIEKNHRILVYEYMENGSLAENLGPNGLDWEKRYEIAVGTAKGLAYLHEECLEWVLHCDVKPQNILLDTNFNPKVADFGLAKMLNRGGYSSRFSRMRGTTGYMAPEWGFNLPITSKVDVYSYGIVVLEMVTGRGPIEAHFVDGEGNVGFTSVVSWVREKKYGADGNGSWVAKIIDPSMDHGFDEGRMEILVSVALQCVEEDKDVRPTMRQVVEMLLFHED